MRIRVINVVAMAGLLVTTTMLLTVPRFVQRSQAARREVLPQSDLEIKLDAGLGQPSALRDHQDGSTSNDISLIQENQTIHETDNNFGRTKPRTQLVLLLSSTPRSGSTFIGELISTYESTVYFFEPLHKIKEEPCAKDAKCLSSYLAAIFTCNMSDEFLNWFKAKLLFSGGFNNDTRTCKELQGEEQKSCFLNIDFKKKCLESRSRLVKVIRARISSVLPLLELIPDLKIVHLYRDPRGFMKSIKRFKNWNHNSSDFCGDLEQDWQMFNALTEANQYPQQLIQLSYEDLARDPVASARSLFKFLFGCDELGASTLSYLEIHTKKEKEGAMSTQKNSAKAAEAWRFSIPESVLHEVENDPHCRTSIQLMNHRQFDSIENARNESISLYLTDK